MKIRDTLVRNREIDKRIDSPICALRAISFALPLLLLFLFICFRIAPSIIESEKSGEERRVGWLNLFLPKRCYDTVARGSRHEPRSVVRSFCSSARYATRTKKGFNTESMEARENSQGSKYDPPHPHFSFFIPIPALYSISHCSPRYIGFVYYASSRKPESTCSIENPRGDIDSLFIQK